MIDTPHDMNDDMNDDSEEPTIPRATAYPATLKLPTCWADATEPPAERTVEVTCDALPPELLPDALPFVPMPKQPEPANDMRAARQSDDHAAMARCGRVAAELVASPAAEVLARHGLTAESWRALEIDAATQLASEAERGESALRDAYDDAYLRARAAHRGPFDARAFDSLCAEIESGRREDRSASMAQDIADAMRFRRRLSPSEKG